MRGGPAGDNRDARTVAYFDFFGTRFFGPDLPDGSASSPWQGQASLKASKARVMPGSLNRSGLWSRYRNRTLALSKMLPCTGGHARTSGGRFRAKNMAVSIIPSHAPADRAWPLSWNEPSASSSQYLCASAPVSTTVPLAFPMTKSARLPAMIYTRITIAFTNRLSVSAKAASASSPYPARARPLAEIASFTNGKRPSRRRGQRTGRARIRASWPTSMRLSEVR